MELAGEVESVGKNVTRFTQGDRVFGTSGFSMGAHAEYICLREKPEDMEGALAKLSDEMSFEEAAAISVGGLEALHFIRKGNIQKGHAVGFGDIDKDGDQDIYVVMGGSFEGDIYQDIFFENPMGSKNNWVVLKLEGVTSNRSAIGARIDAEVEENGRPRHIYEMVTTGSSFGGNSLQVEMGLGQAKDIKSLTVNWPSRKASQQNFQNIGINQAYHLKEGGQLESISYINVPFEKKEHHHH